MQRRIPKELVAKIKAVTAKRPRVVLDHILERGFVTTEELTGKYGYAHAPRAARDVRELGIPLETFNVMSGSGRRIAAYRLNITATLSGGKLGRRQFPKKLKEYLLDPYGAQCAVCGEKFDPTFLQVDHRVPYEVGGEIDCETPEAFMLLCGSCNRTKSWACEHCENWRTIKKIETCNSCYWGNPSKYVHVAMINLRRADLTWQGDDIKQYDRLRAESDKAGESIQQRIKRILAQSSEK